MILLDPDLDPHPAPRKNLVAPLTVRPRPSAIPWPLRIPSKPPLTRFLAEAKYEVRLRGEVNILLTTDAAIRRLNRQFRAIDKPTDVLSFPVQGLVQNGEKIAGDLAISVETARRQAADHGHALTCELKVLILHGLLHLAGHDHEADNGKMARRELQLRARLRLPQGLIERAVAPHASALKGHGFRRAAKEKLVALKGHGFSRAEKRQKRNAALAAEGMSAPEIAPRSEPALKSSQIGSASEASKRRAPSIPRPHAEWMGNHKSKPRKSSPGAPSKRSGKP